MVRTARCTSSAPCVAVISFVGVEGAAGYVVERPGADDAPCALESIGVCLALIGEGPTTSCSFRLVAVDDAGNKGTPSEPFCIGPLLGARTRRG